MLISPVIQPCTKSSIVVMLMHFIERELCDERHNTAATHQCKFYFGTLRGQSLSYNDSLSIELH